MSVEVRPQFDPPIDGLVYMAEGKALADALQRIYSFSKKQKIRSITDFVFSHDAADDDEADSATLWHTVANGLDAVRTLAAAIRADPKAEQRWNKDDPDGLETLLQDLDELANCLEQASAQNAKFRLEIS